MLLVQIEGAKFWNLETGQLIKSLSTELSDLAFSRDGKKAISASSESISLFDVETDQRIKSIEAPAVLRSALSPDGKIIAFGKLNSALKLLNVETGKEIKTLQKDKEVKSGKDQEDAVIGVVFSPDGKILASQANTGINLWNVETGKKLKSLAGHKNTVHSAAFSPDGKTIASGSSDGTIKLWNVESGALIKNLECRDIAFFVAFSPDGRFLLSGCGEKGIKLWDGINYKLLATLLPIHKTDWIVKDSEGNYDASKGALVDKEYLILPDEKYVPGLLQKIYTNQSLPDIAPR